MTKYGKSDILAWNNGKNYQFGHRGRIMDYRKLGMQGEGIAAQMLEAKGYHILERNYRCRLGEIDIVAERHGEMIFVEVKTRSTGKFGRPAEAVTEEKLYRMQRAAKHYVLFHSLTDVNVRFDVVEVYYTSMKLRVHHLKGVVQL